MPRLTVLYAERNIIRELPRGMAVAMNLSKLMLSENLLTSLPDDLGDMPALKTLDVRSNPLNEASIPKNIRRIEH